MKTIRVITKLPGKPAKVETILDDYKVLQKYVDGVFDIVSITRDLVVIVNDCSAINGMKYNCSVLNYPFFGPMIIAGRQGPDLADVPLTEAAARIIFPDVMR